MNLLPGDLKDLQQKDPTLRTCIRRAQKDVVTDETSNKAAFLFRNGILYRQVGTGDARNSSCVCRRPNVPRY